MSDPRQEEVEPSERTGPSAPLLVVLCVLMAIAAFYIGGLAGFFRWEEKATTKAEYIRRAQVRNRVYAPVIWLKAHDRSGAVRALILWEYRICHNKSFDPNRLP